MRILRLSGTALSAVGIFIYLPQPSQAQQPGVTYDCDTASNHYSELVLPAPGKHFTVTGRVRLMTVAAIDQYTPLTRLTVSEAPNAPGQSPANYSGFTLTAIPGKLLKVKGISAKDVVELLNWNESVGGKPAPDDLGRPFTESRDLPFTLTYDGATITTSIDGRQHSVALVLSKPSVRLVCSTGEFLYTGLVINPS